jgi:hypothetical protein
MAEVKKTAENVVAKATEIVVAEEKAKKSFADKCLMKAEEQAAEGKFFRAGFNRILGNIAKHPVATGIAVGAVGAAGAIGYALGAAHSDSDNDGGIEDADEFADSVEVIDEPVE